MNHIRGIRAVVFDCDGVLVDSEASAWRVWTDVLAGHGVVVDAQDIRELTGRTQPDVYRAFARRSPLPTEEVVLAEVARRTAEVFARQLRPFPDAVATIGALAERSVPVAVASSSPRWRLDASLRAVDLDRHVGVTVAGDEVEHGKPAPDLYLAAARGLGVEPVACVAVEDTAAGVASAAAAGMRVVGVRRPGADHGALDSADRVVDRIEPSVVDFPPPHGVNPSSRPR